MSGGSGHAPMLLALRADEPHTFVIYRIGHRKARIHSPHRVRKQFQQFILGFGDEALRRATVTAPSGEEMLRFGIVVYRHDGNKLHVYDMT